MGITDYVGIDSDSNILDVIPAELKDKIRIVGVTKYLETLKAEPAFDRVVMIDVLEHFNPAEGAELLKALKLFLKKDGGILIRVPNSGSPWGLNYQFGDLTHKAAYTSTSLKQLAYKAGYKCNVFENRTGNPRKQFLENIFHATINLFVTEKPEFWSANIIGFLKPA